MTDNGQVFGPPREADPKMVALTAKWVATKTKYRNGDMTDDAYSKERAKFTAARTAWKKEQDTKRGVS